MPVKIPDAILDEAFRLPAERAIDYLKSKGLVVTSSWREALDYAAQQSFTIAQSMRMDILQSIRDELKAALTSGETFATFQKNLAPTLKAKGWWGEVNGVQTGSPWRLKTIYQTNVQSAYAAGKWELQQQTKKAFPYLMYSALRDPSTRPTHKAMNGFIAKATDPIWKKIYPPCGFNCRCSVRSLTEEKAMARGGPSPKSMIPAGFPDEGFGSNPGVAPWTPEISDYDKDIWKAANA